MDTWLSECRRSRLDARCPQSLDRVTPGAAEAEMGCGAGRGALLMLPLSTSSRLHVFTSSRLHVSTSSRLHVSTSPRLHVSTSPRLRLKTAARARLCQPWSRHCPPSSLTQLPDCSTHRLHGAPPLPPPARSTELGDVSRRSV